MKKKLVFVMTADGESEGNRALAIHFASIKRYSHIFDEAMCVIHEFSNAYEGETSALADRFIDSSKAKETVVSVRKIKDEDVPLFTYESEVLYRDVLCGKENDDKVIFFAHAKGYKRYSDTTIDQNQLDAWNMALWFLSLEYYEHHLYNLENNVNACFSGTFYGQFSRERIIMYSGTFYWVIPNSIKSSLNEIEMPTNRWFAEMLPFKTEKNCYYFPNIVLYPINPYYHSTRVLNGLLSLVENDYPGCFSKYKEYVCYLNEMTGLDIKDCTLEIKDEC